MALEDVDKKSKNRTSKWKNLLKSRKYEKQKCRIDEKFSEALLQLLVLFQSFRKTDNLEEKQQCDQRKIRVQLSKFKKTYMDVIVKAVEAEIPEKIVKFYIWDAMNEEEKEQGDNKLRDLDGNEIKNDNVPQKGVQ